MNFILLLTGTSIFILLVLKIFLLRRHCKRLGEKLRIGPNYESKLIHEIMELRKVMRLGVEIMKMLQEHGPTIVPYLLDDDENVGERFREAVRCVMMGAS